MSSELVHELFAVRAIGTPEALAVAGPGLRLTYRELDLRAGRLARRLAALGVGPEVPAAVLAGRSPEALVAILAVLKAGGCYLPLDPAYPEERLAWILADSGASVLLTQGPVPAGAAVRVVRLDEEIPETEDGPELPRASLDNLAYVIYTSGSTGRPKGVEVEHRGLASLAAWHRRAYGITAAARATRLAGSAFDASVWEVWPYLTAGASLHIPDDETVLQPPRLARWLAGEGITHTFLPTPLAEAFLDEPWPADAPLEALLTGGDRLHRRPRAEHAFGLFNHYGPTENSVVTTWGRVEAEGEGMPSIGRPIDGVEVVPDESGELLIGGVGLARGYRGRPDLTAERFVPAALGRRLYRTGDLVRLLPSGELDFIGRIDFQVKIRGFRIELGEIEAALRRHPAVREGVVLARDGERGGKRLVGYVALQPGEEAGEAELRAWLSRDLPDYMVPAAWVFLDALPLTPNGKVDRAALPAPEIADDAYVAPRTETEAAVAGIFAEVLGLAKAGARDDFFALGGHSLTATQVLSRVRSRLGVDLPPRALFDHPTVAALAQKAGSSRETAGEDWEIRPVPRPDAPVVELPASFSQQGLWLADRLERGVPRFNTPFALELSGPLDVSALSRALSEIVRRHEPLRTTFREENGRLWQEIARPAPVPLPVVDFSGLPRAAREREAERWMEAEARRPLDLSSEPMLQLRVFRLGPGEHVLLTLMHHIVSDDWSLWVFASELAALYAAFSAGRPSPLPEPALGYGDFAVWQRQWLAGARLEQEVDWWRARLQPPLPVLDLPADRPRPAVRSWRGARLCRALPAELAAGLSALGRERDASLFIVLLAAFDTLLSRLTASLDVLVGSPIANRHRIEVEGLIGYFVNVLALRGDLAGNPRFEELVSRLRETVLAAYGHQDIPFGLLVEELAPERDLSRSPLTDVYLVLGNAPRPPGELAPGLRLALRELETGTVQGDLSLHLAETEDGISAVWGYSLDLFDAATAERMAGCFETLLAGIVAAPAARLADLPLLSPAERAQLPDGGLGFPGRSGLQAKTRGSRAERAGASGRKGGAPPRTPVEEAVAGIFAELLGVPRIGVQDDFFALGGHSLLAAQVLSRVHRLFGVELPIRTLFERPTVEALARRIEEARRGAWGPEPPLGPRPRDGAVPLSFGQERLWIADQLGPGQPVYNIPLALHLRGPLAVPALAEALAEIVRRHEALRTTFPAVAGEPVQAVAPPGAPPLPVADLAGLPEALLWAEAGRLAREEALRPFDLSRGPLVRRALVRLGDEEHRLLLSFHHIVADGWSLGVLFDELAALYGAFAAGRPSPLPELPFQLPDFALWQREWLAGGVLDAQLAWWRERLAGGLPVLELPTDRPRPAVPGTRGATERLTLPAGLADGLRDLSRRLGATFYMTLLAAFDALLGRLAGQDGVVVGSPVANRNRAELERLIGFFVNTVLLRGDLAGDPGFPELVGRVREEALGAWAHQDVPFDKLALALAPGRDPSRSPLFQVSFELDEAPRPPLPLAPGLTLEVFGTATDTAKFDLSLAFQEVPGGLGSILEYATGLFDAATVRRMLGHLATLLSGAVSHPEARISDLPLLTAAERQELEAWNAGLRLGRLHPEETTVRALFGAQAVRTPDAPAVIFAGEVLTYAGLRGRALRIAARLQALGVGPEVPVGVCCDRTPGLVAAFVAVMEAGGVYVPLDPSYPPDRIAFLAEDAGCAVVLAEGDLPEGFARGVPVLAIDGPGGGEPFVPPALAPQNLAYVIYTSGSTGNPKPVGVSQGAAAAHGVEAGRGYGLGPGDRLLLFASPGFDVSVENLLGPLLSGAALVPRGPGLPAPGEITRRIAEAGITVVNFAPAYWIEWVRSFEGAVSRPASLRLMIVGGDEMPGEAVRLLGRTPLADVRLLNVYGPTEVVVTATLEEVRELPADLPPVLPVGRPFPGRSAHVLDRHGNLLPVGVPGEAALGGLLARGYLGHPALTAERFVPDPFAGEPGARLYRTGDLVRRRPGGGFDFLGRVDRQVKIRGVRVEPGEIEAALLRHPGIAGAVVAVRPHGGEKALVAWVVPRGAVAPSPADLRADLAARLPAALVPAAFVVLDAFPLTPNGKVDRRALPSPEREERAAEGLAAPRTPAEELLAGVWADLLEVERVGVDQDFFALGGHSLLATRLVSRVRDLFGVELPLRAVFEAPTVAALAARIAAGEKRPEAPPVLPRQPGERLLLSFGQERLWILDRLDPGTAVYNVPLAFRVQGPLEPAALAGALSEVVRRHEALRTTFETAGGEPVQAVAPPRPFPLPVTDLSELPEAERETAADRLAREEALRPFDLERGPLFRAALLRLAPEDHRLLLTLHHIVSDGWSVGLLLREISAFFEGAPLPEPAVQYPDFALWQRRWLEGGVLAAQLSWWRERLAGELPVLPVPADRPRPAALSQRGAQEGLDLPAELAGRLRELSRRQGATLYMTLLAAFDALLCRYTGQDDLLVGSPIAGRNRAEVEGTIGFFVNTLVLRASVAGDPGFSALLARVREAVLGAWAHPDVPFERLVSELAPKRDLSRSPLFQVSLTVESAPPPPLALGPGLTVSAEALETGTAKFDLSAGFQEVPEGLVSLVEYATDLFDAATIRRMLGHLATLLAGLVARPEARISELPLLSAPEREEIAAWNGAARQSRPWPEETTLRDLFEAQAARTPDAPAIVTPEGTVSYAGLRSRALRIAARLQALGVGPEVPVGVWCDRTAGLVTAFVAVIEAGGVYVPLDPSYPPGRIAFMVEEAGCAVLLAEGEVPAAVADRVPVLPIDAPGGDEPFVPPALAPQSLAYVIYTSGSTGTPKRVGVPHGPAATQGIEAGRHYGLGPGDRFLLFASPSFDVSVENLLGPLLAGAALVPRGAELPEPAETTRRIAELAITVVNFAPAYWSEWVKSFAPGAEAPPALRLVIVGGDEMPGEVVRLVQSGPLGHVRLLNAYGPTEAVVTATLQEVLELPGTLAGAAPVGRPLPGRSAHALDRDGNPVPVGVPGEMYLGGLLARGYLGHPALTAERFGPDPFSGLPGARLYRTGDLVRRRPDGAFEFAGRADHQVKIRGFRVEPGEIEAAVLRHPDVESAVVAVRSDGGEKRLVAYVIPREGRAGDLVRGLRADLASRLPAFMVPAAFVLLSAFPMTPNGKVDRRALPAPEAGEAGRDRAAPRTPTEQLLARAWGDLLGTAEVFADDHFFELGGHSLLATRLVSRVREVFGVELPLKAVFASPVLADLAAKIDAAGLAGGAPGTPAFLSRRDGQDLPLSFSQQRLWFLDRLEPGTAVYNLPSVFRLRGELGIPALAAALSSIVRRHEVLRTTYGLVDGDPVQVVHPPAALPLPVVDLGALPEGVREAESARRVEEESRRPFSLEQGPVLRTALVRLAGDDHRLLLSLHHVAGDGWSLGILLRELGALYAAALEGRPSPLPELPLQYADFALWQRRWLAGGVLEAQLAFWREALAGCPLVLELPADRPRPAVQSHRGAAVETPFPADLSARLEALSRERGATLFMTLLAAAGALLHRYTGEPDLLVGTPVANRNRAETEPLIGFFVNSLALRASFADAPSFAALLDRTRDTALAAYDHQDLPFERLVEELAPQRDLTRAPIFQVSFTLGHPLADGSGLAPGLSLASEAVDLGIAKLDLSLGFEESARGWAAGAEYATDLFDEATVRRMLGHLENLLAGIAASPEARVSDLPLLSAAERDEIAAANAGLPHGRLQPEEATVRGLFEAQVERTPDAPALVTGDGVLSYADLRARALRIAARLQALGVGPEVPVGVWCDRTPGLVLAFVAVIEAGGVYVPLDPSVPPERTAFLVADARCAAVLAETDPPAGVADRVPVLAIDGETEAAGPFVPPALDPQNLAYIIYTSGSTGTPKRVGVSHGAAAAHAAEAGRCYGLGPGDRFLLFHGPAFDPSLENMMGPLVSGAALVPRGAELPSPAEMTRRIEAQGITAVNFAPVYWVEWARSFEGAATAPPSLRLVIVGGEEMPGGTVRLLAETPLRHVRLVNVYAPTEAVITSNVLDVWSLGGEVPRAVPLGPPLPGRSSYVLDFDGHPLPPGVPGEVVLGGLLARGYLDQPALTAERFVPDPFSGRPGARLYRTGDRARRRADGAFDFVGRTDFQVKIRGYRVEPGEVEAAVRRHPRVAAAVVVAALHGSEKRLVAYAVPCPGESLEAGELQADLAARLPSHMVPAAVVILPALPLTANGKVNRRALPAPEWGRVREDRLAPRTPGEELLARAWAELLGLEAVGVRDDFFQLGGHSLLATRLVSRIRDLFGVELPLRALFEAPTVEALAARIEAGQLAGAEAEAAPVSSGRREQELPLSFAQQRLWFLEQLQPGNAAYNLPAILRLGGALSAPALQAALAEIVRRHEVLRTVFTVVQGEARQVVEEPSPRPLPVVDLSGLPEPAREAESSRRMEEEARTPFDLRQGPVLRERLLRLAAEDHRLLLTFHHIAADGWSTGILLEELGVLYDCARSGRPSPLPELPLQYADFALWQRRWLEGGALEAQLAFWREALSGCPLALDLPADRPRPAVRSQRGAAEGTALSAGLSLRLEALSHEGRATLFMTLLAAFGALLSRYTGEPDLLVGTPVAGRTRGEIEPLIGFFVNTLALRTGLAAETTFRELLVETRETALAAYAHQDLPFERLVEELAPERDLSRTPIVQVSFLLAPSARRGELAPGLSLAGEPVDVGTAKFDLTLAFEAGPEGLEGGAEYATDLFDAATVQRMLGHFATFLAGIAADPAARVSELPLLSPPEREQLLVDWNRTEAEFPRDVPIHRQLEAWAARTPDAPAVIAGSEILTYAGLNRRANRLARGLAARGAGPEVLVALDLERSPELVVAALAVLKAGGAYVPVNPRDPAERRRFILGEAGGIRLDRDALAAMERGGEDNLDVPVSGESLAYVIYTSGSTGRPKGVAIPHRGVSRLTAGAGYLGLGPGDRFAQLANPVFDASVLEIWAPLLSGAAVVVIPHEAVLSSVALADEFARQSVTAALLTPALFHRGVQEIPEGFSGLRCLLFGGEAADPIVVRTALAHSALAATRLVNAYGPTESTVIATVHTVDEAPMGATVPIGRPVPNTRVHVLDGGGGPAPVGVPGELCLGGEGLARGYLHRPDLTAERFVPDPFAAGPGERLYRTGDLARFRPGGEIEFLGRIDHQVKVRGFRIELGEIEATLAAHPGVTGVIVLAREDAPGDRRLVAYVTTAPGEESTVTDASLRRAAQDRLPDYMVPSAFVILSELPLTPNGKVDRRALPAPERSGLEDTYVAPRTPLEVEVAGIWGDVLGIGQIGLQDGFFDLGGHSLLATRVLARIEETFGIDMPLQTLFESPTLEGFAAALGQKAAESLEGLEGLSEEELALLLQEESFGEG